MPGRVPLSLESRRIIKEAMLSLPPGSTYRDLARITGFAVPDIRDYLLRLKYIKNPFEIPKSRKRRRNRKKTMHWNDAKPQFVREVEETTGLTAVFINQTDKSTNWGLMSPKGVMILTFFGTTDIVSLAKCTGRYTLQGISREIARKRKATKAPLQEKPQENQDDTDPE